MDPIVTLVIVLSIAVHIGIYLWQRKNPAKSDRYVVVTGDSCGNGSWRAVQTIRSGGSVTIISRNAGNWEAATTQTESHRASDNLEKRPRAIDSAANFDAVAKALCELEEAIDCICTVDDITGENPSSIEPQVSKWKLGNKLKNGTAILLGWLTGMAYGIKEMDAAILENDEAAPAVANSSKSSSISPNGNEESNDSQLTATNGLEVQQSQPKDVFMFGSSSSEPLVEAIPMEISSPVGAASPTHPDSPTNSPILKFSFPSSKATSIIDTPAQDDPKSSPVSCSSSVHENDAVPVFGSVSVPIKLKPFAMDSINNEAAKSFKFSACPTTGSTDKPEFCFSTEPVTFKSHDTHPDGPNNAPIPKFSFSSTIATSIFDTPAQDDPKSSSASCSSSVHENDAVPVFGSGSVPLKFKSFAMDSINNEAVKGFKFTACPTTGSTDKPEFCFSTGPALLKSLHTFGTAKNAGKSNSSVSGRRPVIMPSKRK